jgi:hypothetical protein
MMQLFNKEEMERTHQVALIEISNADELKIKAGDSQLVYVLTANDQAIVLGRGNKNRAKIILDRLHQPPTHIHYKAMFVRMYQLMNASQTYRSFIVICDSVGASKQLESILHRQYGGEGKFDSDQVVEDFVKKCNDAKVKLLLKLAYHSSFSGLDDLCKWRKKGLIPDVEWLQIVDKLKLYPSYCN